MKRILLLAGLLLVGVTGVSAQTSAEAKAVIDRYNQAAGLSSETLAGSALMDVHISTAGASMPMKIIKGTQAGCYRIEMSVPGQGEVLMVTDGKNGWVAAKGQPVQALPKQVIGQMASQGDMTGTLSVDDKNFDYTFVGASGGNEIIEGKPKAGVSLPVKSLTMKFSTQNGLLTSVATTTDQGQTVQVNVSDYKKFGGALIPTRMETTVSDAQNAVVTIKNIEFGIPTEPWMFAKPAPINK